MIFVRFSENSSVQSYQVHLPLKHEIAEILEKIRLESKKYPEKVYQIRNRTPASITKRYLYERDLKKLFQYLEDAKKLYAKYQS